MKSLLQGAGLLALLAFSWLCGEGAYSVRYARQRSVYTFDQLNKVLRETSQTLDEVRKGATTWREASKEQTQKTTQAMSNVSAAAARITSFISRTDDSVNLVLLPGISKAIQEQNASLLSTQTSLQSNLNHSDKILTDTDQIVQSVAPKVERSVDSLTAAAQNTASATADGAATMKDVRIAVDKEVHDLLAPVSKVKTALLFTAQLLGRLYGF
jgi:hypothetical protein